jgi:hypothetical protein
LVVIVNSAMALLLHFVIVGFCIKVIHLFFRGLFIPKTRAIAYIRITMRGLI